MVVTVRDRPRAGHVRRFSPSGLITAGGDGHRPPVMPTTERDLGRNRFRLRVTDRDQARDNNEDCSLSRVSSTQDDCMVVVVSPGVTLRSGARRTALSIGRNDSLLSPGVAMRAEVWR